MGVFQRLTNMWKGFVSLWVTDLENANPEAVYEAAILERMERHKELRQAVGNIVFLRNKITAELSAKQTELEQVTAQLPVAVQSGDDAVALLLIQQKDALTVRIAELQVDLEKVSKQAETAKEGLTQFQTEIEKLRRERDEMLAARSTAEARIRVQETMSGLSLDADVAALENVRTSIRKLEAEADLGDELSGSSLDARLAAVRNKTTQAGAQAQLDALKKQVAAASGQAEGGVVPKTM